MTSGLALAVGQPVVVAGARWTVDAVSPATGEVILRGSDGHRSVTSVRALIAMHLTGNASPAVGRPGPLCQGRVGHAVEREI